MVELVELVELVEFSGLTQPITAPAIND